MFGVNKRGLLIVMGMVLCACDSETPTSGSNTLKVNPKEGLVAPKSATASVSVQNPKDSGQPLMPASPTRSELRVITEQAKATEEKVQNIIMEFDANINVRNARKLAEDKFKKQLPEYKEKMLLIGKAKLKENSGEP